jgi:cellulose synthase/poly-beta-1,6-N-acetylglucosamine synthase-like glycosyltransferase
MTLISIIITAYREPDTVGRAIEAFLAQAPASSEILVVCPDPATTAQVDAYAARHPQVRHVADPQRGKPAALNYGLAAATGEIVVLSDGDVVVADDALAPLLAPFEDPTVGATTGRPISTRSRDSVLGYWSHFLTDSAHHLRLERDRAGAFLLCSGYLFAFRKALIEHVPEDALAEDAVISHRIAGQGKRIRYAPAARVRVKYPTTYADWLRQKVRSAGGYAQDYVRSSSVRMRSPALEALHGLRLALRYPQTLQEAVWTILLFAARLHLWILVFIRVKILHRPLSKLWQRVESTK